MADMTHLDEQGRAKMVDVGDKDVTRRTAVAAARVRTTPEVIKMIAERSIEKGDVLAVARVAGIMAAKKTAELIPLCHPIPVDSVAVDLTLGSTTVEIRATARTTAKTGLEMEALTAASIAALAVYDMCKSVDKAMTIEWVRLEEKSGGKSGEFKRNNKDS